MQFVDVNGLKVARQLHEFITDEALPGTGVDPLAFWQGFADLFTRLTPRNQALLDKRDALQSSSTTGTARIRGRPIDTSRLHRASCATIGYLVPEPPDFAVTTANVDAEIARIAGPQLVVPVTNARYALNAANARWGSLYDALYGTDAIPEDGGATRSGGYNPVRGAQVVAKARAFLDQAAPLNDGSHADATLYALDGGTLCVTLRLGQADRPRATRRSSSATTAMRTAPSAVLLQAPRPACRDPHRPLAADRPRRSRRRRRRGARSGRHHHHGLRGLHRRRRCRRQGASSIATGSA